MSGRADAKGTPIGSVGRPKAAQMTVSEQKVSDGGGDEPEFKSTEWWRRKMILTAALHIVVGDSLSGGSLNAMSDDLGCSWSHFYKALDWSGEVIPSIDTILRVAELTEISLPFDIYEVTKTN